MKIPFVGPTYNLEDRPASVQRSVNLMPVPDEPGNERSPWVFKDAPGLTSFSETPPPPRLGLLDPWATGLTGAFGRVLLRGNYYGPYVRLQRSSDNAQADFGPVDDASYAPLEWANVIAWLGGASGYIITLYDQSGEGRDLKRNMTVSTGISINTTDSYFYFDGATGDTLDATATCGEVPSITAMISVFGWGAPVYSFAHFYELGRRYLPSTPGAGLYYNGSNPSTRQLGSNITDGAGVANCGGDYGQISNIAGSPGVYASRWQRPHTQPAVFVNAVQRSETAVVDNDTVAANFTAETWRLGGYGEDSSNNALLRAKMFATWEVALTDADIIDCSEAVAAGS